MIAAAVDAVFVPPIAKCPPVTERPALSDVLDATEMALLARYIFDNARQVDLAEEDRVAQTTVSYRVRKAVQKLRDAGLPVTLRGKGRRPAVRAVPVDPLALGCLKSSGGMAGDNRPVLKWAKAKKVDDDQDSREW